MAQIPDRYLELCGKQLLPPEAFASVPTVMQHAAELVEMWSHVHWVLGLIDYKKSLENDLKKVVDLLRPLYRALHSRIKEEFESDQNEKWAEPSYICVAQNRWVRNLPVAIIS